MVQKSAENFEQTTVRYNHSKPYKKLPMLYFRTKNSLTLMMFNFFPVSLLKVA